MEKTDLTYRPAWRSYCGHLFLMLVILILTCIGSFKGPFAKGSGWMFYAMLIVMCLAFLGLFFHMFIKRFSIALKLRDYPDDLSKQEIAFESGIMKNRSIEIGLSKIQHMEVTRTIFQRMLGLGTLVITSAGTDDKEVEVADLYDPYTVRDLIQVHARKYTMNQTANKNALKESSAPAESKTEEAE